MSLNGVVLNYSKREFSLINVSLAVGEGNDHIWGTKNLLIKKSEDIMP
jgi:hypothetical protein